MNIVRKNTLRTQRPIELRWITSTHPIVQEVLRFLREHFHPNEPLNCSINLMASEQNCKTLDALYRLGLKDDATAIALDAKTGHLVGVLINSLLRKGKKDEEINDPDWNPTPVYDKFLKLIVQIHEDLNLFTKYPYVDTVLDHGILSVAADWQGEGISQHLVKYSNDVIAKGLKCGMALGVCSSLFSAKLFEKCGYSEMWKKKFRDYKENGVELFPTAAPHDYITCQFLLYAEGSGNDELLL